MLPERALVLQVLHNPFHYSEFEDWPLRVPACYIPFLKSSCQTSQLTHLSHSREKPLALPRWEVANTFLGLAFMSLFTLHIPCGWSAWRRYLENVLDIQPALKTKAMGKRNKLTAGVRLKSSDPAFETLTSSKQSTVSLPLNSSKMFFSSFTYIKKHHYKRHILIALNLPSQEIYSHILLQCFQATISVLQGEEKLIDIICSKSLYFLWPSLNLDTASSPDTISSVPLSFLHILHFPVLYVYYDWPHVNYSFRHWRVIGDSR